MEKVKWALTILSIAIIAAPLLIEVYAYQNNLVSLAIPPQIQSLINGQSNSNSNSGSNGGLQMPGSSQTSQSSIPNFQMPSVAGQIQYDPSTGAFSVPFNVTNPLKNELAINQLSAEVVGADNTMLGNVSITPVNIASGANAIVTATGNLSQNAINQLEQEYQSGNLNISLENVNVNLAGISIHIDEINNIGQILASYGVIPSPTPTG